MEGIMDTYKTKYFGEISFNDTTQYTGINVSFKNKRIHVSFLDKEIYNDKITQCLNILDEYSNIYEISKNAILNNYSKNKNLKNYFKYCFKNLDEKQRVNIFGVNKYKDIDFKYIIEKLEYPNLYIGINNNELQIEPYYILSNKCSFCESNILIVNMDESLNILGYRHGVILLS
jgi:hypothetical protein